MDVPEGALLHNIPIDHQGMISRDAPSPVLEEPDNPDPEEPEEPDNPEPDNPDPEEPDNLEPATPNLSPNPLCVLVEQLHTSSLSFSSPVSPAENIEQIIIIRTLDNDLCPDPWLEQLWPLTQTLMLLSQAWSRSAVSTGSHMNQL